MHLAFKLWLVICQPTIKLCSDVVLKIQLNKQNVGGDLLWLMARTSDFIALRVFF